MTPLSDIQWGPYEALKDRHFFDNWIEPSRIKNCLDQSYWIVTGEKGSGKTALRRALVERYRKDRFAITVIDFDDLSFLRINERLKELALATDHSPGRYLVHYWQYCLIVEAISSCYHQNPQQYGDLYHKVPKDIRLASHTSGMLLRLIESAILKVHRFIKSDDRTPLTKAASTQISNKLIQELSNDPINEEYRLLVKAFYDRLSQNGHKILLVLDGFDLLKNDIADPQAIQLVFSTLVSALQKIDSDIDVPEGLEIKAFIPHDQYIGMKLRDGDKISEIHSAISWDEGALRELISQRIKTQMNLGTSVTFDKAWRQVFPASIVNKQYSLPEESFQYLLRHTMMRPRQLQIHLTNISKALHGVNVDPSSIPRIIRESSEQQADHFVSEYALSNPEIPRLLSLLKGHVNVMPFKSFVSLIKKSLEDNKDISKQGFLEDRINKLYSTGFFGVLRLIESGEKLEGIYSPPSKKGRKHTFEFYYKRPVADVYSRIMEEDLIGIHALFYERAVLKPHESFIVG